MSKRNAAIAGALSALLLASCGGREAAENTAAAGTNAIEASAPSDPPSPDPAADNRAVDTVPPPDAVSHPEGYLPPAPAEPAPPGANSSDPSPPATEDEYIRNRQAGR
jgi:hypothetical protein